MRELTLGAQREGADASEGSSRCHREHPVPLTEK